MKCFYVKPNSRCEGVGLQFYHQLSVSLQQKQLMVAGKRVKGWCSIYGGSACSIKICKSKMYDQIGFLVTGGDFGLWIQQLSRGTSYLWLSEKDLPKNILAKIQ